MCTPLPREKICPEQKQRTGKGKLRLRRICGSTRPLLALAMLVAVVSNLACRREPEAGATASPSPPIKAPAAPAGSAAPPVAVPAPSATPQIVFLGDSLTAGLGLGEEAAFPARVGELLAGRGLGVRIVNAGVSGDTSAGGVARIDWLLSLHPQIVVVALGANDGLRGQPVASIEANLREIVRRARAAGAQVVLAGMKMPPNYGPAYTRDFEALFARVAAEFELPFIPFLLEGVAADPQLNQADGIHPTAEGQRKIALLVERELLPLLSTPTAR